DKHNWFDHFFDVEGSMVREILGRVTACVIWSAAVVACNKYVLPDAISPMPHTLVGVVLGLLMVFRPNASYDRYWEGRRQWGRMIKESRNVARCACAYLKGDRTIMQAVVNWSAVFPYATMNQLRGEPGLGAASARLPAAEVEAASAAQHRPLGVALRISE